MGYIYRMAGDDAIASAYYQRSAEAYRKFTPAREKKVLELLNESGVRLYMDV